jgi:hypothetical protein
MVRSTRGKSGIAGQGLWLLFLWCIVCISPGYGQDSLFLAIKTIGAGRLDQTPVIDGLPDKDIWKALPLATEFVQFNPYNGSKPTYETEIRLGYNETGLYVGAFMHDPYPDSINNQLGKRDQVEELNTDYLSVDILPYNDGLTMFEFKISPANLQADNKYSATGKESSWDAVWESATSVNDSGWVAEFFIPYSALRFPRTESQTWGINMWRKINRLNEMSTWSYTPNNTREIFRFYGTVTGMEGIKPPLRLSLTPYVGGYLEKRPGEDRWSRFIRGGMDLKYGISQSYTLDMELVPDFGQVQSDDIILNLTPFEVRYAERRQFFTEGTEMFEKCDIFYSRRVGGVPVGYGDAADSLLPQEKLTKNPDLTQVINATKISGRDRNGLGIGVFNGMTTNTWATAEDTLTGASRRISTQPFTNYNVVVFDQNLMNNSYVTFINTNYWTPDWKYNANVTGGETKLVNKANTFAFKGLLNVSQIYRGSEKPLLGYTSFLNIYKPQGTIRYSLSTKIIDDQYDPNDMGYLNRNNEIRNHGSISYNIYQPVWKVLNSNTVFEVNYNTRYQPNELMMIEFEVDNSTTWKNFWRHEVVFAYRPLGFYDYYEPRVDGWYYHQPPSWGTGAEVSSDSRKQFAAQVESGIVYHPENQRREYLISVEPRYRISDRLTTSFSSMYDNINNDYGWVETRYDSLDNPTLYFGRRQVVTVNNVLDVRYVFTTAISLNLRARHYWSRVEYQDYHTLQDDGELASSDVELDSDIDFNAFNLDLQFIWNFAPGSELSAVWKNNILTFGDTPSENYFRAFEETMGSPQTNSFSVRVLYYLDYAFVKKAFGQKKRTN